MIRYSLTTSPIAATPGDQMARVNFTESMGVEELIDECLLRGSTLTKPDLRASLDLLFRVMIDKIAAGVAVITPVMNMKVSIGGSFRDEEDGFDRERHEIRANGSAGVDLKLKLASALVEKIGSSIPLPKLIGFHDTFTQSRNSALTPGNIATLNGEKMKFDEGNPLEGLFFINVDTAAEVKVQSMNIKTDGKLSFLVPVLAAGTYKLQVRRVYTQDGKIRAGELNSHLTVS